MEKCLASDMGAPNMELGSVPQKKHPSELLAVAGGGLLVCVSDCHLAILAEAHCP